MKTDMEKVSYVLGQSIGGDFKRQGFEIDPEIFAESFKSAFAGEECKMPVGEMQQVMQGFQRDMQEKQQAKQGALASVNLEKGKKYLDENKEKEGVQVTASGLQYKVVTEGDGKSPSETDTVVTHYEGRTLDGDVFDSSYKRGTPATFPVNGVIQGWIEALQLMKEGSKWELFIPADLAYGSAGSGGTIEPNSTLLFTIELLSVN